MKLALALNQWPLTRAAQQAQLSQITDLPVQRIYLGETVCSQRDRLGLRGLLELQEQCLQAGQQLILSSLNLIASARDLALTQQLMRAPNVIIEANDMAAVALAHEHQHPFIAGSGLNIYNLASLQWLLSLGMIGYQPPLEITQQALATLLQQCQHIGNRHQFELEMLGWGYPPLAVSARCSSARVHGRNRQRCRKVCQQQGAELAQSLTGQAMMRLNGTQIHGAEPWDLLAHLDELTKLGVDWLRIVPAQGQPLAWLAELATAIRQGDDHFTAPICGRARLWQRQHLGDALCAD